MKNRRLLLLLLSIILVLTSCDSRGQQNKEEEKYSALDDKGRIVLANSDYAKATVLKKEGSTYYYKEIISIQDAWSNYLCVDLANTFKQYPCPNGNARLVLMGSYETRQGEENITTLIYETESKEDGSLGEVYAYDFNKYTWKQLLVAKAGTNIHCLDFDGRYLVWLEDQVTSWESNWLNTTIHVFDLLYLSDEAIYTCSINPETNQNYFWQDNAYICNEQVFFTDADKNEKGEVVLKVFSYDLEQKKLTVLDTNAKQTMEYLDAPAWLRKAEDGINSIFYSSNPNIGEVAITSNTLASTFSAKGDVIAVRDNLSEVDFQTCYPSEELSNIIASDSNAAITGWGKGLRIIKDGKSQLVLCKELETFDAVSTNGSLVGWAGVGDPMVYDVKQDKLVKIVLGTVLPESSVKSYYIWFPCEDYIVLSVETNPDSGTESQTLLLKIGNDSNI